MDFNKRIKKVAIFGAASALGTEIASAIAIEIAKAKAQNPLEIFKINCLDQKEEVLFDVRKKVQARVISAAEKSIVHLREIYVEREDLIENSEIIHECVEGVMHGFRFDSDPLYVKQADLVFFALDPSQADHAQYICKSIKLCKSDAIVAFAGHSEKDLDFLDDKRLPYTVVMQKSDPPNRGKPFTIVTNKKTDSSVEAVVREMETRFGKSLI